MKKWTFITNHGAVLAIISRTKRITALDIANQLGITERSVRRVIADLVDAGYIDSKRERGVNEYELNPKLPLRRPEMQDLNVKELLECLSAGRRRRT